MRVIFLLLLFVRWYVCDFQMSCLLSLSCPMISVKTLMETAWQMVCACICWHSSVFRQVRMNCTGCMLMGINIWQATLH